MKMKPLGNSELISSTMGLGLMGMSHVYGQADDAESIKTIHRAMELGVTMLDTADVYGNGHNEELLGKAIKGKRDSVLVATKFGFGPNFQGITGHPDYVRSSVEASLVRLGIETIDLYYQHRVDPSVPIEETVGAMAELIKEGKVRQLGLSEASADEIRRAHTVHPIAALQTEYSLWSRDIEEEILPALRELNITHVAYSPLSRGFLSGSIRRFEDFAEDDMRQYMPRFKGENFNKNIELVDKITELAEKKNVSASQMALAWVMANGALPIPGTRHISHLEENIAALDIMLTPDELKEIEAASPSNEVSGTRY
ncbi:aldo/keto reductase [Planococcus sp. YIM B11945]|uniref:aldo/keto reductase n=1 Tax=Planococcus sp. YIM B11945 TaxID=3435410 RepID=UPI003D7D8B06